MMHCMAWSGKLVDSSSTSLDSEGDKRRRRDWRRRIEVCLHSTTRREERMMRNETRKKDRLVDRRDGWDGKKDERSDERVDEWIHRTSAPFLPCAVVPFLLWSLTFSWWWTCACSSETCRGGQLMVSKILFSEKFHVSHHLFFALLFRFRGLHPVPLSSLFKPLRLYPSLPPTLLSSSSCSLFLKYTLKQFTVRRLLHTSAHQLGHANTTRHPIPRTDTTTSAYPNL
ncbi:hypothetical protein V8E51_015449 [Hyaloscypha variabilis]